MNAFDHPSGAAAPRRHAGGTAGRLLLVASVVFALLAAAVLVLADEARWLRLGVVAALWAALVAAFAAARHRRDVAGHTERAAELQRVYELELEREVAARREYELEVDSTTRRRVEEEVRSEVRGELDGLRTELRGLRQNLEALLGGEVLVERVALRAESTRLRSLSDQSRAARTGERALPRGLGDTEQTREWTPETGRAYAAADADVLSSRVERAAPAPWPTAHDRPPNAGDRTDVLPSLRYQPARPAAPRPQPTRPEPPAEPPPPRSAPSRVEPSPPRPAPPRVESSPPRPKGHAWPSDTGRQPVVGRDVRPAETGRQPMGSREMWRADLGRQAQAARDPRRAGTEDIHRTPPASRDYESRTAPHRLPLPPPARDPRSGPSSDPLGVDRLMAEQSATGEHPRMAWESFDSWVSTSGSQRPADPGHGGGHRPDETGSYILPGLAGRGTDPAPAADEATGRRHRSDDDSRSVQDFIAAFEDQPEVRSRHRREA